MKLKITVKTLGKKRAQIEDEPLELNEGLDENSVLTDLITAVVKQQVMSFNEKRDDGNLLKYLSKEEIKTGEKIGKIGFGEIYNKEKADEQKAVDDALLGFTDGLYFVFINEKKIETLDTPINIKANDKLMFIRLIALTGGYF